MFNKTMSAVGAAVVLAMSAPASAQTEIAKKAIAKIEKALTKVANACSADLRTFCSAVSPGEGRIAFCLAAHEDKVSGRCYEALLDIAGDFELASNRLMWTAKVCEADIAKVCGSVRSGEGRIAQCLVQNKPKLQPACRTEVTAMEARLKK